MKGIVFTEFLEMVEARLGLTMVDRIIVAANLPNDGAYTSVGSYDHAELVRLVVTLSEATGTPVPQLIREFGEHLFQRFSVAYPGLFEGVSNAFDFLRSIDNVIHVEVLKLYPDAELPTFSCEDPGPGEMTLLYRSPRGLGDLAEGLIRGCISHFQEPILLARADLPRAENGDHRIQFHLTQKAA